MVRLSRFRCFLVPEGSDLGARPCFVDNVDTARLWFLGEIDAARLVADEERLMNSGSVEVEVSWLLSRGSLLILSTSKSEVKGM